jgi:DNA-binding CsgD family transcriptional regulator
VTDQLSTLRRSAGDVFRQPIGLVILGVSALVAFALTWMPQFRSLSDRAVWVVAWGALVYVIAAAISNRASAGVPTLASDPAAPAIAPPPQATPPTAEVDAAEPRRVPAAVPFPDGLTRREVEVLCLLAQGLSNKEIARVLVLTVASAESHVAHIYQKTGAHNRVAAAAYASRHGLCQPAAAAPR